MVRNAFLAILILRTASAQTDGWYEFHPRNTPDPGEIGMQSWFEKPAGTFGRIQRQTDHLVYHNKPIKLWGLNLCYADCSPAKELAEKRATFYPKYGINSVRLHKYVDGPGWRGIQSKDSCVEFDAAALDRFDYQVAKFKEAGIFIKLSAHFGTLAVGPADKPTLPFVEEFGRFTEKQDRINVPHSAIFYSHEIQKLHITQTVNLLKHRNNYTGLTYAEDPAVAFVEIVNEQSVLFYTSMAPLKASATLRKEAGAEFTRWLRLKYKTKEEWLREWGEKSVSSFKSEGFADPEDFDKGTILPLGNPFFFDPDQLKGSQAFRRQRLLDTLQFLTELQLRTYQTFTEAVRKAGYKGELIGSNWQAGRALSHFANLWTDAEVGTIDRHNYFGGGDKAPFRADSMLSKAGSGLLSSGLQQVDGHPFMLSEWIHVYPNEWGVEGPAIIGAYGMGLQGWDVSYLFQNRDSGGFSSTIGRDRWDATAPQILGIFPAVARQVLRGDVSESSVVAHQKVHAPSLYKGELGFEDKVKQSADQKELDSIALPARALAAVKCVTTFTKEPERTPKLALASYEKNSGIESSTRELFWRDSTNGYFTINTPGTKAIVGFAQGEKLDSELIMIQPNSPFTAIYCTAQEKTEDLSHARRWLIVAMARARNTGMKFNEAGNELLAKGSGPILLEPVKATLTFKNKQPKRVLLLDHDGLRTEKSLFLQNSEFHIDGAHDQSPYYLIEWE